jgi:predicted NUDIX family NTP pyrophosphohydrolase
MKNHSAGLIVFRQKRGQVEVLLAHMGGPFHAKKDNGHWSIPKGLIEGNEDTLQAAKREFEEELGLKAPPGKYIEVGDTEQHNHKIVTAWAVGGDLDASNIKSNFFEIEWPPKSGKTQEFPEIDRAGWFSLAEASVKVIKGQARLFEQLADKLKVSYEQQSSGADSQQASLF